MAKGDLERADDVAAGRRRASSAELIDLVRAVNPTGRELPAKTEGQRYRTKSRLQSLLVNHFGSELRVERTEDPAVVGLFHRPSGADACHARIDDLDEEARAWVRFQLDTEAEVTSPVRPASARSVPGTPDTALDPLARGRRALDEYDFDAARRSFEEAIAAGSVEAGNALLEMLVDSLGDFQAAVDLETRLRRPDPHAQTLFALALARTGAREAARRRVESLEHPRSADVWAALVAGAVADGALEEATRHSAAARTRDIRHPELVEADAALASRLSEKRAPDEERLRAAWERGNEAEAESIARAIGGPAAGRILREIERKGREAEGRRLLEEARAALARGDDAADARRRAANLGVSDAEVDAAIAARAAATRERDREARVAWIVERIGGRDGLQAFLDADVETRRRVHATCDRPLLRWAETMDSAEAALALETSVGLERHESLLAKLPEGREALRKSREAAAEGLRARVETALTEALECAAAGNAAASIALLEGLDERMLSEPSRVQARSLLERLRNEQADARRSERVVAATLGGDRFEALLLAREGGEAWGERARSIAGELGREWRLTSFDCDLDLADAGIPALEEAAWTSEAFAFDPDRDELVTVIRAGTWTVVFVVDAARRRIVRVLRMNAPLGLGHPACVFDEGSLWLLGSQLALELDARTLEILGGLRTSAFVPSAEVPHDVFLVGGKPWCWIESEDPVSNEHHSRVVDVRRRRVRCELRDTFTAPIQGTDRVLGTRIGGLSRVYDSRGSADTRVSLPPHTQQLCAHPSQPGFVVLTGDEEVDMQIAVLSDDGSKRSQRLLPDASPERVAQLAASSESGLVFACVFTGTDDHDRRELLAWRVGGAGLEPLWNAPVSRSTTVVTDPRGRRAMLVAGGGGAISLLSLSEAAPEVPPFAAQPRYMDFPDLELRINCRGGLGWFSQLSGTDVAALRGNRAALDRITADAVGDPAKIGDILASFRRAEYAEMAENLLATAEQLNPGHPELELARAELALANGRHAEAIERLRGLEGQELSIPLRHRSHLLGIAQYLGGDDAGAKVTWEGAAKNAGQCNLDRCLSLVAPEGTALGELASAIRAADSMKDPVARSRILAPHWVVDETQSRARYAAAWLDREVVDEIDIVRKLAAVAWLPAYRCSRDLPLPGATWSRARILAVTSQAIAWLETL